MPRVERGKKITWLRGSQFPATGGQAGSPSEAIRLSCFLLVFQYSDLGIRMNRSALFVPLQQHEEFSMYLRINYNDTETEG